MEKSLTRNPFLLNNLQMVRNYAYDCSFSCAEFTDRQFQSFTLSLECMRDVSLFLPAQSLREAFYFFCIEESDLIPVAPEVHTEVVPTKMVVAHMSVTFLAQFRFFDFSGRTDSRFMRHMISDMAPRHLVIVHGSSKACRSFKAMAELELVSLGGNLAGYHCTKCYSHTKICCLIAFWLCQPGINERVYCPDVGETVDVSSGTSSFRIAVSDEIMERVNLRTVKGYQLAWVEGRVEELEEVRTLLLQ